MNQRTAAARAGACVLVLGLLASCSGGPKAAAPAASDTPEAPVLAHFGGTTRLPALHGARLHPDVLVTGRLTAPEVRAVSHLAPGAVTFQLATARIGKSVVRVASVDPLTFRRYTAPGTAESTALWQAVAAGQLVASHAVAKQLHLTLGRDVTVRATRTATLRLGGLATTGIPGTDLVVSSAAGTQIGLTGSKAVLLTAGKKSAEALAAKARKAAGKGADVDLLTAPAGNPMAFLTGSRAARAFGAFSYRYFPDGTIQPDSRWVRNNIASQSVPILGTVTCHRLMLPQLRGALREVVRAGLASKIHSYDGCYVPRFMERDPHHPVSLHTWGIAIDLDARSNGRGTSGTMDRRVVAIFKRWGFRWGGDWSWTDPMHFELGALLRT
ncbi:MAG TPA: M15 family metallopeptidase [Mycobacteriales bacterium]|nr:M15 family metallopeptidase [Mycobacteriales bacterium]